MEGDLIVAIGGHFLQVGVPRFARIDAQLLARFARQQVPGALDVRGSEGLAVVPFDALTQGEGQFGAFLVPRPARRQIGHDRLHAGLRHILLVHDEVVEDVHHRLLGRPRRFLEDRHAGRTVEMRQSEDTALLLGERSVSSGYRCDEADRCRERTNIPSHPNFLPFRLASLDRDRQRALPAPCFNLPTAMRLSQTKQVRSGPAIVCPASVELESFRWRVGEHRESELYKFDPYGGRSRLSHRPLRHAQPLPFAPSNERHDQSDKRNERKQRNEGIVSDTPSLVSG
jgi:hypothetical protein